MGNKIPITSKLNMEHCTGKLLLKAIRENSKEGVRTAIETARQEFVKPISKKTSNASDYKDMVTSLINYIEKKYDIGDGPLFLKTPLEYCDHLKAERAKEVILEELAKIKSTTPTTFDKKNSSAIKVSKNVGVVDQDRAALAKAKLKEIQQSRNIK